ncbi:3971_t:CDS:1, partial [Scutellospora calospora]
MNENKDLVTSLPPIKLCESNRPLEPNNIPYIIDFWHLPHFHVSNVFIPILQKSVSKKTRWSKGYEIAKKVLNLMIQLNCDDEFFNIMEKFIST